MCCRGDLLPQAPFSTAFIKTDMSLMKISFLVFASMACEIAACQSSPTIKVQARANGKSVKLRWAPDTPVAWKMLLKYGYTVERILVTVNGRTVADKHRIALGHMMPQPLEKFEEFPDDDNVAICAQAIYGDSFEIINPDLSPMLSVVNRSRELESRFSYALFAADQSVEAARLHGLFYEDRFAEPGGRYLYRIVGNVPPHILAIDTAFILIGVNDIDSLDKVKDVQAEFGDKVVMLSWDAIFTRRAYSSYVIERSESGKPYKRISTLPFINAFQAKSEPRRVFKSDSLRRNEVEYSYRIIGKDIFGNEGPPSDVISGKGIDEFSFAPSILGATQDRLGNNLIQWKFPDEGSKTVKSFDLISRHPSTNLETPIALGLADTTRSFLHHHPSSPVYYVVRATDAYGRTTASFPFLVQAIDSLPPACPTGITGAIDTLGHVVLRWNANTEDDLMGYAIYTANFSSEEFVQKGGDYLSTNLFIDSININNLSRHVFYKIRAIDTHFNSSDFSAAVILRKPDMLPPVPPVFRAVESDTSGINISWYPSASEDVERHLLFRRSLAENTWTPIMDIPSSDSTAILLDADLENNMRYAYTMIAVDSSGHESKPATPVTITYTAPAAPVRDIYYNIDKTARTIKLSWSYNGGNVEGFQVYRSINSQPYRLFRSMAPFTQQFTETYQNDIIKVSYRIVATFPDGRRSPMSDPIEIKLL